MRSRNLLTWTPWRSIESGANGISLPRWEYKEVSRQQSVSGGYINQEETLKIARSNHRASCARLLLAGAVSVAALALQPPLLTSLNSDQGRGICPAQASKGQIAADRLLNDIVYRRIVSPEEITSAPAINL